jgi:cytochrome c oxidase cbb3-type subunit 2
MATTKKSGGLSHERRDQQLPDDRADPAGAAIGGLVEIVPLFFQKSTTSRSRVSALHGAATGRARRLRPRGLLQLPLADDPPVPCRDLRYGHYSVAGESVYDHPFQWGSKRTGPDLARVGGKYSDEWHRIHLINPRDVVPESNMPAYPWLEQVAGRCRRMPAHMRGLRTVGVPYTDEQIAKAREEVKGKTELDAVIAYPADVWAWPSSKHRSSHGLGHQHPAFHRPPCSPSSPSWASWVGLVAPQRRFREAANLPFEQGLTRIAQGIKMSDFTSNFWSIYVAGITHRQHLGLCLLLLWFSGKAKAMTASDNTTGHVWDGDLREMNNPLPRWWVWLFVITVVFALVYLVLYPGPGTYQGQLGWSPRASTPK